MSNLSLELDYRLRQLVEPGFHSSVYTRDAYQNGFPEDEESHQGLWADPLTHTLMLKPLQLREDWLDTSQAGPSIIRLDNLVTHPDDITNGRVFEQPVAGNPDNPWIHHNPVGPSSGFPTAVNPMPGAGPSLTGVTMGDDPSGLPLVSVTPPEWYLPSATMPPANSLPSPSSVGGMSNSRMIAYSAERMPANQALFLRWFSPDTRIGYHGVFWWYVGQFVLGMRGSVVEVWKDTSADGSRRSFTKVMTTPLFGANQTENAHTASYLAPTSFPIDPGPHDRTLLWLPFRQNQVLLLASTGKAALLQVNHKAARLADNSDWDITRADTIGFRCLTKAPGRFQIQKVAYTPNSPILQAPYLVLEYVPTFTPTITLDGDHDHGTMLTAAITAPPGYTPPENVAKSCGPVPKTTGDQSRTYGVKLHMTASGDQRWTPFFYGYHVDATRTFGDSPATPLSVGDASPVMHLSNVKLSAGLAPGEGRFTADLFDPSPFDLATKYYRTGMPVKLTDSSAGTVFIGICEPNEVIPLRNDSGPGRRVVISGLDLWKVLGSHVLRGQRDYQGVGHIDAVKRIVEEGGIEATSLETLAGYTPNVISALNSALGGSALEKTAAQKAGNVKGSYQPAGTQTAADFIQFICKVYSGWIFGFRLDGTPFYLPRDYFTTPSVTFSAGTTGAAPHFSGPVTFRTIEPEANWIRVMCGDENDGSAVLSPPWVDWASVRNPNVVNYLGRFKRELVKLRGTHSCAQLNWVARRIWNQTRRRFREVEFEGDWVPTLKIGQVFVLAGYGSYRLTGFNVELRNHNLHRASYKGELLESGVGL